VVDLDAVIRAHVDLVVVDVARRHPAVVAVMHAVADVPDEVVGNDMAGPGDVDGVDLLDSGRARPARRSYEDVVRDVEADRLPVHGAEGHETAPLHEKAVARRDDAAG